MIYLLSCYKKYNYILKMRSNFNSLIIELINRGKYECSFHTLTFNITSEYTKDDLQKAIQTYLRWLKNLYLDDYLNSTYYIYSHEITQVYHIHIHLILNKAIVEDNKIKLIKNWNDYNPWEWYNKKGLVIKNDYEYQESWIFENTNEEFLKLKDDIEQKSNYFKNKIYDNAFIILN